MRICLIATEFAGIGSYGGFGVLTRDIAMGLKEKDLDVYIAMPRRPSQKPVEIINGITIVSYPSGSYTGLKAILPLAGIYQMINADIYHSQEPSIGTSLAKIAVPNKKHLVTFQDPRTIKDWRCQWAPRQLSKFRPLRIYRELKFQIKYQLDVGRAVRKTDANFCQAKYIIEKATRIYRLKKAPGFLPNPVQMPCERRIKAENPTVCFLGRWDSIKRPELFLELALKYPRVKFIATGACLNNSEADKTLREQYTQIPNIELPGWVGAKERADILGRSWILINTSTKECLPISYLEANAHRCAILSHGNADEFASKFGYWAQKGDIDDYANGLETLLENDKWKELGERGYEYVKNTHEYNKVIDQHIKIYKKELSL